MEKHMKDELLKNKAAWGSACPRPSGGHEWEPGCVHHAESFFTHQAEWIRLNPFDYSSRAYDEASILQKRAFVDLVSLLSASSRFDWQANREFWKDVFDSQQYWGRTVTQRLGEQPCVDRLDDESSAPRFMIDFERYFGDISMLEWCYAFLTASTADVLSAELSSQFPMASPSQEPRRIAIGLDLSSCRLNASGLNQLHQILAAYAEFEPDRDESASCQVVQYVITSLNLSQNHLSEPQNYEILTKIMLLQ